MLCLLTTFRKMTYNFQTLFCSKTNGLLHSRAKSTASYDFYSPETRRHSDSNRGKTYDESTVQALIKAAVSSALQYAEQANNAKSTRSAATTDDQQNEKLSDAIGIELSKDAHSQIESAAQKVMDGRLAILEDRVDGIETMQMGQLSDAVPMEKFLALQFTVAQLEGRLKMAEEYIVQSEAAKTASEEQNRKDQTALKEFIINMENNQRKLMERLSELESTLETDSETSIGLLDMLLKKLGDNND
jgi:hypothetical protein